MPTRKANAEWRGGLQSGAGSFSGESGVISGSYSFGSRFGETGGTNPEELLAAAEAACYSMALSLALEKNGTPATRVSTEAACTIDRVGEGFAVTTMRLHVRAEVDGVDEAKFRELAEATKTGCPISKVMLNNVRLELDAQLEQAVGAA